MFLGVLAASSSILIRLGLCFDLLERFSCFASDRRIRRRRDLERVVLVFGCLGPAVRFVAVLVRSRKLAAAVLACWKPSPQRRWPRALMPDALFAAGLRLRIKFRDIPAAALPMLRGLHRKTCPLPGCRQIRAQALRGNATSFSCKPRHHPVKSSKATIYSQNRANAAGSLSRLVAIPAKRRPRDPKRPTAHCPSAEAFPPGARTIRPARRHRPPARRIPVRIKHRAKTSRLDKLARERRAIALPPTYLDPKPGDRNRDIVESRSSSDQTVDHGTQLRRPSRKLFVSALGELAPLQAKRQCKLLPGNCGDQPQNCRS